MSKVSTRTGKDLSVGRSAARRQTGKHRRAKPTDKESGFESCPNSPRSDAAVEACSGCQCGAQKELRHQSEDCVSLDSFRFIKKLGSGGYGSVVLVEKRRGRDRGALYALKITNLNRAALVERDILPRLRNVPYTTDLAYAFFSASQSKAFLALPYAIGKDLFSLAGPGKRPGYLRKMFVMAYPHYVGRVRMILAELSAAIRALHRNRILYRDLKLENILVSGDGHIRLADFGLSRHFEPGESTLITGKTGTPDYMAPEVIRSSGNHGPATQYSFEADLWGLGVIAYELIVGQLPFKGRELADLEQSILHDPVELPHGYMEERFSLLLSHERPLILAALSFVNDLLQRQPNKRLTAEQLRNHVFFRDLDWKAVESGCHDDPPFDIRRVVRELPSDEAQPRLPSAFSGIPSEKKERREKASNTAYENPSKYKNYGYCSRGEFAWFAGDLHEAARVDSGVVPADASVDDDDSQWDVQPATPLHLVLRMAPCRRPAAPLTPPPPPPLPAPCSPDSACGEEDADSLPACPASPDYPYAEVGCELSFGVMAVGGGRLPSHPASPSGSGREDSDDDVMIIGEVPAPGRAAVAPAPAAGPTRLPAPMSPPAAAAHCGQYVVDMFPRVRRVAKRRLSFADAVEPAAHAALTLELATALSAALPVSPCGGVPSWSCWEPAAASHDLPPKKRRRFLHPLSAAEPLTMAEPRVVVQAQPPPPLPPFSSLRHRGAAVVAVQRH